MTSYETTIVEAMYTYKTIFNICDENNHNETDKARVFYNLALHSRLTNFFLQNIKSQERNLSALKRTPPAGLATMYITSRQTTSRQ